MCMVYVACCLLCMVRVVYIARCVWCVLCMMRVVYVACCVWCVLSMVYVVCCLCCVMCAGDVVCGHHLPALRGGARARAAPAAAARSQPHHAQV